MTLIGGAIESLRYDCSPQRFKLSGQHRGSGNTGASHSEGSILRERLAGGLNGAEHVNNRYRPYPRRLYSRLTIMRMPMMRRSMRR